MNITIGENIKRLRRQRNITQEQLAEALNVSTTAVSKWERCDTYPDITLLFPLAYYFGITLDELMGYNAGKIQAEIDEILENYRLLQQTKPKETREFITSAYRKYPNDFSIMHRYMWELGGSYADNDSSVLLEHKDEFLKICAQLDDCPDIVMRLDAQNMRAKLLHAEGKTDDALAIYRDSFPDRYQTYEQKSEQLFAKDTPEFAMWLTKNMLELAGFAVNKKMKEIWYCQGDTLAGKAENGLRFAQALREMREKYGYIRLCYVERKALSDHVWKMAAFGVSPDEIAPALEQLFELLSYCDRAAEEDAVLRDLFADESGDSLVKRKIRDYETVGYKKQAALLENPVCRAVFDKWKGRE